MQLLSRSLPTKQVECWVGLGPHWLWSGGRVKSFWTQLWHQHCPAVPVSVFTLLRHLWCLLPVLVTLVLPICEPPSSSYQRTLSQVTLWFKIFKVFLIFSKMKPGIFWVAHKFLRNLLLACLPPASFPLNSGTSQQTELSPSSANLCI